jgi:hypothetical protein
VQTAIRPNHVAFVKRARGGSKLRIGDRDRQPQGQPERSNRMATLKVKDVAIELDDRDHALINSHINDLKESVAQLTTQLQTVKDDDGKQVAQLTTQVTTLDTAVKAKDAEIVTLKKQLDDAKITPEKLRDAARAYQTVCDQAKAPAAGARRRWQG